MVEEAEPEETRELRRRQADGEAVEDDAIAVGGACRRDRSPELLDCPGLRRVELRQVRLRGARGDVELGLPEA